MTLVQTGKIDHFPTILFGSAYWSGLLGWLRERVAAEGKVDPRDLERLRVSDDVEEVVSAIRDALDATLRDRDTNGAGRGTIADAP